MVWENILVRSYNSPAPAADPALGLAKCDADVNGWVAQDHPGRLGGCARLRHQRPTDPDLIGMG